MDAAKGMEGRFIDASYYDMVIDHDADVYWNDNGTRRLLFHFRKGIIPGEMLDNCIKTFKKAAQKASSMRGHAAGPVEASRVSANVLEPLSANRYRSRVVFKDGTISNYYVSNKVNSLIAGYFDKPKLNKKKEILRAGAMPCRTTAFTERHTKGWESILPMITLADSLYKGMEPERHAEQLGIAEQTPQFRIDATAFSTLTVNYNWRTACHVDAGDYRNGYSVILVAEEGKWGGGFLGYPRFKVCVDVRHGDFLLKDPHQQHANTELIGGSDDWTRLSMVLYYREGLLKCREGAATQLRGGYADGQPSNMGEGSQAPINVTPQGKRGARVDISKLSVHARPGTTDEKVIGEVLRDNVYELKKIGFFLEPHDRWLDLGGNIGTFALLALLHGCQAVMTCEPEADNLRMLKMNLNSNFPGGPWKILPVAITVDKALTTDFYLCKGDYNKYRHTTHKVRGRQRVTVKNMNILDVLDQTRPNAIKMDIEGAEIPILEALSAEDYTRYGIQKLVFEYSFDVDPSIARFMAIIATLRQAYRTVHFTKVKETEEFYRHFPAATIVYCINLI
jgi:FkbM family methyltransferase